jgi:hypothetical protein
MNKEESNILQSLLKTNEYEQILLKEIYSKSYYEFYKQAYKILLPGEHYSDNWHIKYLCDRLQEECERIIDRRVRKKDLVINVPFRSSKSLICTVVYPVWCWIRDQSMKFICTSYSASLALEHAQLSRSLIWSEWFQDLYADKIIFEEDVNAAGFYKIKGGGYRKSIGINGTITGSGADQILCLPSGQMIMTEIGLLNIKNIVDNKLNVKILSYNHEKKINEYVKIIRYDKNKGKKLIKINIKNSNIVCTEDHEIWTENRGYIKAKELLVNDILLINDNL